MSDQPKPTTGEWTAESVGKMISEAKMPSRSIWRTVADAHNAAVAAERDNNWRNAYDNLRELKRKLAAEKSKPKTTEYAQGWDDHVLAAKAQIEELEKQLAAERKDAYAEGYNKAVGQWLRGEKHSDKSYHPDCPCELCRNHLQEQLAAEKDAAWKDGYMKGTIDILEIRQQLADSEHRRDLAETDYAEAMRQLREADKQLAAERGNAEKAAARAELAQIALVVQKEKADNATENCMTLSRLLYAERKGK